MCAWCHLVKFRGAGYRFNKVIWNVTEDRRNDFVFALPRYRFYFASKRQKLRLRSYRQGRQRDTDTNTQLHLCNTQAPAPPEAASVIRVRGCSSARSGCRRSLTSLGDIASPMFARKGTVKRKRRSLSRCQASRRRSLSLPGTAIPLSTPAGWTGGSPVAESARQQRLNSQSSNGQLSIYDTLVQLKVSN